MSVKVLVPKEVAEAIEELRSQKLENFYILMRAKGALYTSADLVIKAWAFDDNGEGTEDLLMQALVNGYYTEMSAEEKVREYFERTEACLERSKRLQGVGDESHIKGTLSGVKATLTILGIKIEGVND